MKKVRECFHMLITAVICLLSSDGSWKAIVLRNATGCGA